MTNTKLLKFHKLGENQLFSFSSSLIFPDLINRFLLRNVKHYARLKRIAERGVVRMNLVLPAQNLLSKFSNRVQFMLYFLLFEALTLQTPRVWTRQSSGDENLAKNKRERRKALDALVTEGFSFETTLWDLKRVRSLVQFFSFFLVSNTYIKTAPSRFLTTGLETPHSGFSFEIQNFSLLPLGFIADELNALKAVIYISFLPLQNIDSLAKVDPKYLIMYYGAALGSQSFFNFSTRQSFGDFNPLNLRLIASNNNIIKS